MKLLLVLLVLVAGIAAGASGCWVLRRVAVRWCRDCGQAVGGRCIDCCRDRTPPATRRSQPVQYASTEPILSQLGETVRRLRSHNPQSAAVIVRTPAGRYEVSPDGTGGSLANEYVITRRQLDRLATENDVGVGARSDDVIIARLAALVDEIRQRRRTPPRPTRSVSQPDLRVPPPG